MVPEFADEHRAATFHEMSQRSNGHGPPTKMQNGQENDDNGKTLLDARKWTALVTALFFGFMNVIAVPIACLGTLFIFLYPIKLFRFN